jgi:hypothetical protein
MHIITQLHAHNYKRVGGAHYAPTCMSTDAVTDVCYWLMHTKATCQVATARLRHCGWELHCKGEPNLRTHLHEH